MDKFQTFIFQYRSSFKAVKTTRSDGLKIQRAALDILKLKDLGQLRDKFEGELFYKKFTRMMLAEIALEKLLGMSFIDWQAKSAVRNLPSELQYEGVDVRINVIDFNEYPVYIDEQPGKAEIFCIKKGDDTIFICGIASIDVLNRHSSPIKYPTPLTVGKKEFTGFQSLIPISAFEDIKQAVATAL